MKKWILWSVLSLLVIMCLVATPTVANVPSKEVIIKDSYVNWMEKCMEVSVKKKLGGHTQTELTYILTRVGQEKFPEVKLAIIRIESRFNQKARGSSGERCLMQVSPSWTNKLKAKGIIDKAEDLTNDVDKCITAGSYIFDLNYAQTKDVEKAVRAYNGGGNPHYVEEYKQTRYSLSTVRDNAVEKYREVNPDYKHSLE
jgi:Transglycosylase SLT domain